MNRGGIKAVLVCVEAVMGARCYLSGCILFRSDSCARSTISPWIVL